MRNLRLLLTIAPAFLAGAACDDSSGDDGTAADAALPTVDGQAGGADAAPGAADAAAPTADAAAACLPLPLGMIAWWPGDGSAADIVGGNTGTAGGGLTFAAGLTDQAFDFNGSTTLVTVALQEALDRGTGAFSIALWFNLDTVAQEQTFFQKISGTGTQVTEPTYFFEYTPGNLRFAVLGTAINRNDLSAPTTLTAGTWHHAVAVRGGDTSTIYLDGVVLLSQTAGTDVDTGTGGAARLGRTAHDQLGITRFVDGRVDELQIFDRALSATDVQQLHGAGALGVCKP